jgi:hypothetical protein
MPDGQETVIGLAACQPNLRSAWQQIIAARLKEIGQRRDAESLCSAISELDRAAEPIRLLVPQAKLTPTGYSELENVLLGCPAEQGPAFPKLLRAVGRTSPYVEGHIAPQLEPLPDVHALTPETNWVANRVLLPPDGVPVSEASSVLLGSAADLSRRESDPTDNPATARLRWILSRPWPLLLAQVVFTQEAWAAEQNAGSLALELAEDQENRFEAPARVQVVVTRPNGEEIICGTLGELLLRILKQLHVAVLSRPDHLMELDAHLAPIIQRLLARQVWKYESRGAKGSRPCYRIHESFSSDCYRIFGAKYFNRGCGVLTAAIRTTADEWAEEQKGLKAA